jgi:CD63 antigen
MGLLSGSANCMKYVLFILNFIFVITGIIILAVGLTVQGIYKGYSHFLDQQFFSVPTLLIVIGSFIFVIAFLGCCGAYKENYCMVLSFSILLVLIFILELSAGIAGYILHADTTQLIEKSLNGSMKYFGDEKNMDTTVAWNTIQYQFSCCGINKPDDWIPIKKGLPMSCCTRDPNAIETETCKLNSTSVVHETGCLSKFSGKISDHAVSLGAVGITLAVFQVVGIIFSCYIARQIKKNQYI